MNIVTAPGKSLRQLSKAVQGVEVRAPPVTRQRLAVQFDSVDSVQAGEIKVPDDKHENRFDLIWNPLDV